MHIVRHALRMQPGHGLNYFRRRRPRITGHDAHARLERRMRHSLVSHQQFFSHVRIYSAIFALKSTIF